MQTAAAAEFEGAGIQLCSDFNHLLKEDQLAASNFYFNWAEGFMSGLNIARLNDETAFKSMTAEEQEAQIQRYCYTHPTDQYFKGVIDLYTTLYPKIKH